MDFVRVSAICTVSRGYGRGHLGGNPQDMTRQEGIYPIVQQAPLANVSELEDIAGGRAKALRCGSKGEGVKAVQKALMELKYLANTTADGDFGRKTEAAAKAFQAAKKLDADGVIGKGTLRALDSALTAR